MHSTSSESSNAYSFFNRRHYGKKLEKDMKIIRLTLQSAPNETVYVNADKIELFFKGASGGAVISGPKLGNANLQVRESVETVRLLLEK